MDRTLICANYLLKSLWAEAINTSNYILNRFLIQPILKRTTYELFKGKKLNIPQFEAFGNKCFANNNGKDKPCKFDALSDEGIFVSYSSVSKTYHVYDKCIKVIEESIRIVFNESNNGCASTSSSFNNFQLRKHEEEDKGVLKRGIHQTTHYDESQSPNQSNQGQPQDLKVHLENTHGDYEMPQGNDETNETSLGIRERARNNYNKPRRSFKYKFTHPMNNLLMDINIGTRIRSCLKKIYTFFSFVSHLKPKTSTNWDNWSLE